MIRDTNSFPAPIVSALVADIQIRLEKFLRAKSKIAQRSIRTIEWYEQQLHHWIKWLDANADQPNDWLDPDLLELYLEEEGERDVLESTVFARYKAIRAFLKWLKRRRMITGDLPTELIEPPATGINRRPRVADIADVDAVIHAAWSNTKRKHWLDYRDILLLQVMRSTGIRVEEVTNLRTNHVDTRDGFIYIDSGKGNKDRIVPFDDAFRRAFTAYLFNRPTYRGDDWLLLSADGHRRPVGQMTTNAIRQVIRRRCKDADIPYFNPHSIRHAFAIGRLNNGMQLSAVSAVMGHTSTAFTARVYARWVKAGLRREYDSASK